MACRLPEEETDANVKVFVEGLCDAVPGCEAYLQSVLPRTTRRTAKIESLNSSLADSAARLASAGAGVIWVNLYPLYVESDGSPRLDLFASDGYHMSGEGYRVWRDAIEKYVYG